MARQVLRQGQLITTYGPGSMVDLPDDAVIVAGLENWAYESSDIPVIEEPRLVEKIRRLLDTPSVLLRSPPVSRDDGTGGFRPAVTVWRFPNWFVSQQVETNASGSRRRRVSHRNGLTNGKIVDANRKAHPVVPIRFVRACKRGHVGDIDWKAFVHGQEHAECMRDLWMEERGTSGDLDAIFVVCECGAERAMSQAARLELQALGRCNGSRPWLGPGTRERCGEPNRLLIRSASNAYFPQLLSVISIPDQSNALDEVVRSLWEQGLKIVQDASWLAQVRQLPAIGSALQGIEDNKVLESIRRVREGTTEASRPVKEVEFEALANVPEERIGEDPGGVFFARALPRSSWQSTELDSIEKVTLVHRLREVIAQVGFTRLEAQGADIHGELDVDVQRAAISIDANWVPAVETRGEGVFIQFKSQAIQDWMQRQAVRDRAAMLVNGFRLWTEGHSGSSRQFPGVAYFMLHSLSHLLLNAIALECGYPSSSLRERIYAMPDKGMFGLLIYTGTSDSEGTLGGLVMTGREIGAHLKRALDSAALCSNDPVCSEHAPVNRDGQLLLGAACHGCLLVAETSCEQRNDFLDRGLVVPIVTDAGAEFFAP
ncbi:MAG: DUF1998 domain-containing protein [Acidobacteria bacterium]|nr:DUF1998 domain-containing protein [Acidobacteriota bacterium]